MIQEPILRAALCYPAERSLTSRVRLLSKQERNYVPRGDSIKNQLVYPAEKFGLTLSSDFI